MSKAAPVTSLNVRRKGEAQPAPDALARGEAPLPMVPDVAPVPYKTPSVELVPLSFKVPPAFKKRYQRAALEAGMKLNEFLSHLLDQHETLKRTS